MHNWTWITVFQVVTKNRPRTSKRSGLHTGCAETRFYRMSMTHSISNFSPHPAHYRHLLSSVVFKNVSCIKNDRRMASLFNATSFKDAFKMKDVLYKPSNKLLHLLIAFQISSSKLYSSVFWELLFSLCAIIIQNTKNWPRACNTINQITHIHMQYSHVS